MESNKRINNEKIIFIIFLALLIVCVVSYAVRMVVECVYGLPSFDGAMNLQVPLQLVRCGQFRGTYNGGYPFDSKIQTKYGVLLPIFFLWKLFGISSVSALLVNAIYNLALWLMIFLIGNKLNISRFACLTACILVVLLPPFQTISMGIYGEIPTLVIFMISIYLLMREDAKKSIYVVSGIVYATAFLTKTIILIALPSMAVVFIFRLIGRDSDGKRRMFGNLFAWGMGAVVTVAIEEVYRLFSVGGIHKYIERLRGGAVNVGKQAGVVEDAVNYADTPNIFEKLFTHLKILCNDFAFKPGAVVFLSLLVVLFIIWCMCFFKQNKRGYENVFVLTMFSYMGWWLIISSTAKAWARRILPGVVLLMIILVFLLDISLNHFAKKIPVLIAVMMAVALICSAVFCKDMVNGTKNFDKSEKEHVLETAEYLKALHEERPDLLFVCVGWWQCPLLSFYSGIDFVDKGDERFFFTGECYLVMDNYAEELSGIEKVESAVNNVEEIYHEWGNSVYYLTPLELD